MIVAHYPNVTNVKQYGLCTALDGFSLVCGRFYIWKKKIFILQGQTANLEQLTTEMMNGL